MNGRAIGVFDSGIGGLTVMAALKRRLPNERILYLGDTARVPYGTKSPVTIQRYSLQVADFLLEREVKVLVVACNTVSAWAIDKLRAHSPVPVFDVIKPGCRMAAGASRNGRIGVIGTSATIRSEAYPSCIRKLRPDANIHSRACPLFVPLAEEGWLDRPVTHMVIEEYLKPLAEDDIDTLVLGCTHYPLLAPAIGRFMGPDVQLISSSEATAEVVEQEMRQRKLLRDRPGDKDAIFLTDHSATFHEAMNYFLNGEPASVELVDIHRPIGE
ncbi:MAG TPA: glutamate racemase [Acidobacteriota bacterium]|nr:glutamate racemase [Acidobacteriota bacterium]